MPEGLQEYFRNLDFIDYLGFLTTILIVIAYFSGAIYVVYSFFMTKFHKYKDPIDPFYDPRNF
jgi:hypothetical protein